MNSSHPRCRDCMNVTVASPIRRARLESNRDGVTLVEVVFSIGVILIGLVGLLSLLPVAGFQARDTVSLNRGTAIAASMLDRLRSNQPHRRGRLIAIGETTASAPILSTQLLSADTRVALVGWTPLTYGAGTGFCIDPTFASEYDFGAIPSVDVGYSGAFFPYYKPAYNPLVNPSAVSSTGTFAWPATQPRTRRVGLLDPFLPLASGSWPAWSSVFASTEQARSAMDSADDLPVTRDQDQAQTARFSSGQLQATTGGLLYGKRVSTGEFTTISTVSPLPDGIYANVTTAVIRNRERAVELPAMVNATADEDVNATSERISMVSFANGFSGGAGGVVHLLASSSVDDSLAPADWLMLSRRIPTGIPNPSFRDVHRWYRVTSVSGRDSSGDAERFTLNGSSTTQDSNLFCNVPDNSTGQLVWRLKVLLDGSDWGFGFNNAGGLAVNYADASFGDNTFATLVENVVSVTERSVRLDEL